MDRAALVIALLAGCGPAERQLVDAGDSAVDASAPTPDAAVDVRGLTAIYANTPDALYRVDPDTLKATKVRDFVFGWPAEPMSVTDIAIDKYGRMFAISNTAVYRVDLGSAQLKLLSDALTGGFNALTFIPASIIGESGDDVLVGTRAADGGVFRIDTTTGQAKPLGDMGEFQTSGDLVSVDGFGTVAIVTGVVNGGSDRFIELGSPGFAGTFHGTIMGFNQVWGLAYWKSRILAFAFAGDILEIDLASGKPTVVQSGGPEWMGAAVTTVAPIH